MAKCCLTGGADHVENPVAPEYQKPFNPVPSASCKGCAASWVMDTTYPIIQDPYNLNKKTVSSKLTRSNFR